MAAFLRRPRTHLGFAPRRLASAFSCFDPRRSEGGLFAGTLLRSPTPAGEGWRATGVGVPFCSWTGGTTIWSYQRPKIAKWGDWACLGLTLLAGGLFWTSRTCKEEVPLLERLLNIIVMYRALRYSLKRKLLRVKLKWFRHKLVLKGLILLEFKREDEACLVEVDNILQRLEGTILYKMDNVTKKVPVQGGDPFLISAYSLLQRIEKLKLILSRKPRRSNGSFRHMDFDSQKTEWLKVQVLRVELLVRQLVKSHAVIEARIIHNKELVAKVDDMLLTLEKER